MSTIFEVKEQLYRAAVDAMNSGAYMTMISYVRVPRGTPGKDFIGGHTFRDCKFQGRYDGPHTF